MKSEKLRKIFTLIVTPITMIIFTLVFSFLYWGPSIQSIGLTIFVSILILFGNIVVRIIVRRDNKDKREYLYSIVSLVMALGLQTFQFWASSADNLTKAVFPQNLANSFNPVHGRVFFTGGEHEIWLELKTNPGSIDSLLKFKPFAKIEKNGIYVHPYPECPEWFPLEDNLSNYSIFQFKNPNRDELDLIIITLDKRRIFYYYLSY